MAWEKTKWACGHEGSMQLYGKSSSRQSIIAAEAGRKCMACWLVEKWEQEGDARAARPDRYQLAAAIAESKGKRISGLPENVPPKGRGIILIGEEGEMPKSSAELMAEAGLLEAQAMQNDACCEAMERTSERTGGRLGHLNNPGAHAAHKVAAADKRLRAAQLRTKAEVRK